MKCAACNRDLQPAEALRVDGKSNGKPLTFFVHRPSEDGRCFRQVVFGQGDQITLVELAEFEKVQTTFPYHCPICVGDSAYGKLLFADDEGNLEPVPVCPNHGRDEAGNPVVVFLEPA